MNDPFRYQMNCLKASQLRAVSSNFSDTARKRKADTSSADMKMRQKKKVKQDEILKQISAGVSSTSHDSSKNSAGGSYAPTRDPDGRFHILKIIVDLLREKHKEDITYGMSFANIQDEVRARHPNLSVNTKQWAWLAREALPNKEKIEMMDGNKFKYKPPYMLKGRKQLLKLLQRTDFSGGGGIMLEDVEESLPRSKAKAVLDSMEEAIISVQRSDKKQILFFNDRSLDFNVDEDLQKLWNSVPVSGLDQSKIEDYLQKHDITSMQDHGGKRLGVGRSPKKKPVLKKKRNWNAKVYNTHIADKLQDYSDRAGPGSAKT